MATFTWNGVNSDWSTAADWTLTSGSGTAPPGSGSPDVDTAILAASTASFTVTLGSSDSYNLAQLDIGTTSSKTASLSVTGKLTTATLDYTTTTSKLGTTGITINAGGVFDVTGSVTDAGSIAETITISGKGTKGSPGGDLVLGSLSTANNSNLNLSFSNQAATTTSNGEIIYSTAAPLTTTTMNITGFNWGDSIAFGGNTVTSATLSSGVPTVNTSGGAITLDNVTTTNATSFAILNGDTVVAVCYARGTMIRTFGGELPVERLRPGKQVMTLVDGKEVPQTVKWLGHRRIDLKTHPRPETVAPIRILRGAFAEAMPHRDLLVSPDHAIFVDGKLICARQLINGATILQETGWSMVDYYHVELDSHAILLAEGLPAESYIDTGNASFFANSGVPLALHPDLTDETDYPTRQAGSCAPFVWAEASVRPVWQQLADRAAALGAPAQHNETTTDADLHLIAKGRKVKPVYADDFACYFRSAARGERSALGFARPGADSGTSLARRPPYARRADRTDRYYAAPTTCARSRSIIPN